MNIHNARTLRTRSSAPNRGLTLNRRKKWLLLTALAVAAAVAAGRPADAQAPTPIDHCGTVISTPGLYSIKQPLKSTSATVDCIQISSSGVSLAITGSLTGPGGSEATAAGIKILSDAVGVNLDLADLTIQGFGVGILVQGSAVAISSSGTGAYVQGNAAQGVLLSNATAVTINSLASISNGAAGLELSNATGVIVQGYVELNSNGGHGLWVNSSSGNQFINIQASDNTLDGIYVGESGTEESKRLERAPNGSPIVKCACLGGSETGPSQHNTFIIGAVLHNGDSGIAIGRGDSLNLVTTMAGMENPGKDAVDENDNCTANSWSKDSFSTTNPSCIH